MFCSKCGTQLSDTAVFCNKCGNTIQKSENNMVKEKYSSKIRIVLIGIVCILICILVILAITKNMSNTNEGENRKMDGGKPSIYGTWIDDEQMLSFTFSKDGNVWIAESGTSNEEMFYFKIKKNTIYLYSSEDLKGKPEEKLDYMLTSDKLVLTLNGDAITFYREEDSYDDSQEGNDLDEARSKLYGAWSDKEGNLTITFNVDNTVRVSGLGNFFGVELFTFTEEDDDTFQLKAYTDNAMLQKVGLNMDYKISGNTMVVTIAGQEFHLKKDD